MLKNISLYRTLLMLLAASFAMSSCNKDDDDDKTPTTETVVLSGEITANRTLSADTIYNLDGYVVVNSGVTLNIEAGTIIKASLGTGTDATVLVITKGATINAVGTASKPIIFTSVEDNITAGQKFGTNLGKDDISLWGGIIILGNAKISATDGDTETQIEGLPANSTFGVFGGTNDADDSGNFQYVSIRHTGTAIDDDNELQGLTLGGVGTGTDISHVEVYASFDDGIEIFGGAVNVNNLLVAYANDDALDLDMNYSGTINNFYVIHEGGGAGNSSFEFDGPEGATYTSGKYTVSNGTVKSVGGSGRAATLKSASQGTIQDCAFIGFNNWVTVEGGSAIANFLSGELEFNNCEFKVASLTGLVVANDSTQVSAVETVFLAGTNTAVTTTTKGATISAFAAWTLADEQNLVD
jgi:hypothetical protein